MSVFEKIQIELESFGFRIASYDFNRPWGGFFVIDESQTERFIAQYFPGLDTNANSGFAKLSPKILVVAPGKRLSWQYHFRRAEIWRVAHGTVGVATSLTDIEEQMHILGAGQEIVLQKGERHRLIGLEDYGIVAEIWQHTDALQPSDEDDIVRLQDDFGR